MILINRITGEHLGKENDLYNIFSHTPIVLRAGENKIIELPYYKVNDNNKHLIWEQDLEIAKKGVLFLMNNLNSEDSTIIFKFFVYNINMDSISELKDPRNQIFGSKNSVTIKSNTLLGKVFEI